MATAAEFCFTVVAVIGAVPRKEGDPALSLTVSGQAENTPAACEAGGAWTAASIGRHRFEAACCVLGVGGRCRTGLGDDIRMDRNALATSDASPVERVRGLAAEHGRPDTRAGQARRIPGLRTPA